MAKFVTFFICTMLSVTIRAIDWHYENGGSAWALDCDFYGNDLTNARIRGEDCGGRCSSTNGCTHFTWTTHNGGTCWMKQGQISTNQANYKPGVGAVCGVMKNNGNQQQQGSKSGKTTRYWDCCKASCGWYGKGPVTAPVTSCQKDGNSTIDMNAQSGCGGGPAFLCNSNQPWAINSNLAYGFAAAHISGQSEQNWCCSCYELTFTSGPVSGKKFVVQVTNSGGDLGENHFDLQIPGGGVGLFNGCTPQWNAPSNGWGDKYGGVGSRDQCSWLPWQLQPGCHWRFDWFMNANNPTMNFVRVKCPAEITQKSKCRRTDE